MLVLRFSSVSPPRNSWLWPSFIITGLAKIATAGKTSYFYSRKYSERLTYTNSIRRLSSVQQTLGNYTNVVHFVSSSSFPSPSLAIQSSLQFLLLIYWFCYFYLSKCQLFLILKFLINFIIGFIVIVVNLIYLVLVVILTVKSY